MTLSGCLSDDSDGNQSDDGSDRSEETPDIELVCECFDDEPDRPECDRKSKTIEIEHSEGETQEYETAETIPYPGIPSNKTTDTLIEYAEAHEKAFITHEVLCDKESEEHVLDVANSIEHGETFEWYEDIVIVYVERFAGATHGVSDSGKKWQSDIDATVACYALDESGVARVQTEYLSPNEYDSNGPDPLEEGQLVIGCGNSRNEPDSGDEWLGPSCSNAEKPNFEYERCENEYVGLSEFPEPVQNEISGLEETHWREPAEECEYDLDDEPLLTQVMDIDDSYVIYKADEVREYAEVIIEEDREAGVKRLTFESIIPVYEDPIRLLNNTEEKIAVHISVETFPEDYEETVDLAPGDETALNEVDCAFETVTAEVEVEELELTGEESWQVFEDYTASPTFTFEEDGYQFEEPKEVDEYRCVWNENGELVSREKPS